MTDPLTTDFAALRVLGLVHAHGSFSRAAEGLGVTQSTVSYTVDRLRRAFGDPLFVRQGGGVVATDRCNEIVAATARMLDDFVALSEPRAFDPAQARAEVRISCNYYERVTILPPLVRRLRRDAPGLRLHVLSSTSRGKEQLSRGESDLLIGPVRIKDAGFYGRRLIEDRYVCVMDAAHAPTGPMSVAAFTSAPHAVVTYGGTWRSAYLIEMEAQGLTPNTAIEVPSPANLPDILIGTDLVGTVPTRVAQVFGAGVAVVDCPFPSPFGIDLYWTGRTHASAMHKWLRGQIGQIAAGLDRAN